MSDAANVEVTLTVQNNTEVELGDVTDGYAADQARAYRDKAGEYAADALNSKNMAEAWAESDSAPAGTGTRSSKTWSEVSQEWAESTTNPDGVTGARSAKTWSETARAWAESEGEPDGVSGAKSAKSWATVSSQKATEAAASAEAADTSAKASSGSAAEAKTSQQEAATQATLAKQSADSAAEKLAQMQIECGQPHSYGNPSSSYSGRRCAKYTDCQCGLCKREDCRTGEWLGGFSRYPERTGGCLGE